MKNINQDKDRNKSAQGRAVANHAREKAAQHATAKKSQQPLMLRLPQSLQ